EGKALGVEEGKTLALQALQEIIIDTLMETFPVIPAHLSEQIRGIRNLDVIKGLHRQAIKCTALQDFEKLLQQAT
ncbi:MAG: hypothetical protein GY801_34895, partial [bacterium]|nr:hypothetical protein [bacterium]